MNTIVVFGSTTGNCEELAGYIATAVKATGENVTVKNVADTTVDELANYDTLLLGSSTWGEGELQDDFTDFETAMTSINLSEKKAAVFVCGESSWELFCEAVDIIEKRLLSCGASITTNSLKVDGAIIEADAAAWGKEAVS